MFFNQAEAEPREEETVETREVKVQLPPATYYTFHQYKQLTGEPITTVFQDAVRYGFEEADTRNIITTGVDTEETEKEWEELKTQIPEEYYDKLWAVRTLNGYDLSDSIFRLVNTYIEQDEDLAALRSATGSMLHCFDSAQDVRNIQSRVQPSPADSLRGEYSWVDQLQEECGITAEEAELAATAFTAMHEEEYSHAIFKATAALQFYGSVKRRLQKTVADYFAEEPRQRQAFNEKRKELLADDWLTADGSRSATTYTVSDDVLDTVWDAAVNAAQEIPDQLVLQQIPFEEVVPEYCVESLTNLVGVDTGTTTPRGKPKKSDTYKETMILAATLLQEHLLQVTRRHWQDLTEQLEDVSYTANTFIRKKEELRDTDAIRQEGAGRARHYMVPADIHDAHWAEAVQQSEHISFEDLLPRYLELGTVLPEYHATVDDIAEQFHESTSQEETLTESIIAAAETLAPQDEQGRIPARKLREATFEREEQDWSYGTFINRVNMLREENVLTRGGGGPQVYYTLGEDTTPRTPPMELEPLTASDILDEAYIAGAAAMLQDHTAEVKNADIRDLLSFAAGEDLELSRVSYWLTKTVNEEEDVLNRRGAGCATHYTVDQSDHPRVQKAVEHLSLILEPVPLPLLRRVEESPPNESS